MQRNPTEINYRYSLPSVYQLRPCECTPEASLNSHVYGPMRFITIKRRSESRDRNSNSPPRSRNPPLCHCLHASLWNNNFASIEDVIRGTWISIRLSRSAVEREFLRTACDTLRGIESKREFNVDKLEVESNSNEIFRALARTEE